MFMSERSGGLSWLLVDEEEEDGGLYLLLCFVLEDWRGSLFGWLGDGRVASGNLQDGM